MATRPTQLKMRGHSGTTRSGAIRLTNAAATGRSAFASGGFGPDIPAAAGYEVSLDRTPTDTTGNDWLASSAGIRAN